MMREIDALLGTAAIGQRTVFDSPLTARHSAKGPPRSPHAGEGEAHERGLEMGLLDLEYELYTTTPASPSNTDAVWCASLLKLNKQYFTRIATTRSIQMIHVAGPFGMPTTRLQHHHEDHAYPFPHSSYWLTLSISLTHFYTYSSSLSFQFHLFFMLRNMGITPALHRSRSMGSVHPHFAVFMLTGNVLDQNIDSVR